MRISDWSSDVCSSDLPKARRSQAGIIEEKAMNGKRMGQMMLVAAGFAAGAATPAAMVMADTGAQVRSEEHTSELQSLMRISYAVLCLKKKRTNKMVRYVVNTRNIQRTESMIKN